MHTPCTCHAHANDFIVLMIRTAAHNHVGNFPMATLPTPAVCLGKTGLLCLPTGARSPCFTGWIGGLGGRGFVVRLRWCVFTVFSLMASPFARGANVPEAAGRK